ncbi:MAG: type pilus biosis/stability protein PilW [Pseudomonadota bacterium]|jgi:type IV pilus assembly protein PilF
MYRYLILSFILLSGCASKGGNDLPEFFEDQSQKLSDESPSMINTRLGVEYMKLGQYDVALQKLQKALEIDSRNVEANTGLALLYERLNQNDSVGKYYEAALAIEPNNSSAHNNYGSFLCRFNRVEEAQAHFKRAVENPLYKSTELAYTNAGLCALKNQDRNQAMDFFRKALEAKNDFPVALFHLADLSEQRDDITEAQSYYKRFVAVSMQTPASLWLGIRLARRTGDKNAEASYSLVLRSKFPESEETKMLHNLGSSMK